LTVHRPARRDHPGRHDRRLGAARRLARVTAFRASSASSIASRRPRRRRRASGSR